ncbi:helix-turn-helix domain-containing protein [Psychroserpens sp. MEBiC05023]
MDIRIQKALDYIETRLPSKLTLNKLAEIACMSPSYFHRIFKKETGRTPFDFIEELKMNKAYALIITNTQRVHELTEMFGYSDYETFTRAFKKHFTLAPDDIRAIVLKIRNDMNVGSEGILIKVFEVDDISQIQQKLDSIYLDLKTFLIEKGYTEADIDKGRVLSIMPKLDQIKNDANIIKNKFIIKEDPKIWETILHQYKNDSN